jgi:5'-nucleotidase/UDP-sugar diphosphatase
MKNLRSVMGGWLLLLSLTVGAQTVNVSQAVSLSDAGSEPNTAAQTVVEAIRQSAGTDIAWLGAAFFSDTKIEKGDRNAQDLIGILQYPDDEIVILNLKGEQIKQALLRAIELYPQRNNAFLQIAGMTVRFKPDENTSNRIVSVKIGRENLDPNRTYTVATTAPLARGALGYFRVWNKDQITRNTGNSVSDAIKAYFKSRPVWIHDPLWIAEK